MNWRHLDSVWGERNKLMNLCFFVFMLLIGLIGQIGSHRVNIYGHLGGILIGFFAIFVIQKPVVPTDGACCSYKVWFIVSASVLAVFHIVGFLCFFLIN